MNAAGCVGRSGIREYARANARAIAGIRELPPGPLYVFGYGSLLWRPGFSYTAAARARIFGFHRALRVWSFHHRGTPERPGLVVGLDRGGSCVGRVYRVAAADKQRVAEYLWEREMVTSVYSPHLVPVPCAGRAVHALTFVIDRSHRQYAGSLPPEAAAGHIAKATGRSGHNAEYLRETAAGLMRLGIHDQGLHAVLRSLDERGNRGY